MAQNIETEEKPVLLVLSNGDDYVSFSIGETELGSFSYDEHGSKGLQDSVTSMVALAEALGIQVDYAEDE